METNGVKTNAVGPGEMKVHTIKLNNPAKNPIAAPAPTPSKIPVRITGIIANVATIGPIGIEPKGVKHMMTSSASKMENCTILIKAFRFIKNSSLLLLFLDAAHFIFI